VSTAIGWHGGDALGVFCVATPARFRGRGYAGLATSAAVAAGFEDGATFAFLQSSALGEPVYRRLGFRQVSTYRFLTRRPADDRPSSARAPGRR
jgi:predicted GNAT family acetyltransferase